MTATACLMILLATGAAAQSWEYTGAMSEPRWIHTLSVLPRGTVLAAGGWSDAYRATSGCEIYDPADGAWRSTAPLTVARAVHTATVLPDGRVVVIGGQVDKGGEWNHPGQTDVIEIFDPVTETWEDGGRLIVPRQNHTSVLLGDGTILVIAGLHEVSTVSECEIYDPVTHTSRPAGRLNQRRHDHHAELLKSGEVLVAGGRDGGSRSTYFNQCEIYNPVSDSWRVVGPMKDSRIAGTLARFSDGSILMTGGRNTPFSSTTGAEILNPTTLTWNSVDPIRLPCTWMSSVLFPDDRYLMTGGFYAANWDLSTQVTTTPLCEWYDRWSGRWYLAPSLNQARSRHRAVYLRQTVNKDLPADLILVSGGHTANSTYTATCEILDVTNRAVETYMMSQQNTLGANDARAPNGPLTIAGNTTAAPVVTYRLESGSHVALDLIGADGRLVEHLVNGDYPAGGYRIPLNTESLPEGAYFVRLRTAEGTSEGKIIVVR